MQATQTPPLTKSGTSDRVLVASDSGNVTQKILIDRAGTRKQITSPSLLTIVDAENSGRGVFRLLEGSEEWRGKGWMMGGSTLIRDSDVGKVRYGLPLLLANLWPHIKDGDTITLITSVHNPAAFKDDLINAYQGRHQVMRDAVVKSVTIEVLGVLQEGVGVIYAAKAQSPSTMLIDWGGGTAIGALFSGARCRSGTHAYPIPDMGSVYLERQLMTHPAVSKLAGRVLSEMEARSIVASKTHKFTVNQPQCQCADCEPIEIDLSEVVGAIVKDWTEKVYHRIERQFRTELTPDTRWVACGGSCLIPAVAKQLAAMNITVVPNPQLANVQGMMAIAQSKING